MSLWNELDWNELDGFDLFEELDDEDTELDEHPYPLDGDDEDGADKVDDES